jgi:predicted kinase
LKSRKQCEAIAKEVLSSGKCPIIDRCNFDNKQRQTWYDLASTDERTTIPIDCLVLQVHAQECIRRCESRTQHETVTPEEARKIIGIVNSQLKFPHRNETCFRSLITIRDGDAFNDAILMLLNQK